eukprot:2014633-Rhodomonas_salina.3
MECGVTVCSTWCCVLGCSYRGSSQSIQGQLGVLQGRVAGTEGSGVLSVGMLALSVMECRGQGRATRGHWHVEGRVAHPEGIGKSSVGCSTRGPSSCSVGVGWLGPSIGGQWVVEC